MCKLDMSNCYRSIRLPPQWRHSFKVYVPGGDGPRYPLDGHSVRWYAKNWSQVLCVVC